MTGVSQHFHGVLFQNFHIPFSDGTIQLSCLTETTATDTASLNLQNDSVLCDFDIRNYRLHRIKAVGHIRYQLFADPCGNSLFRRSKGSNGAIFMVSGLIEPGHIHSRQLCRPA